MFSFDTWFSLERRLLIKYITKFSVESEKIFSLRRKATYFSDVANFVFTCWDLCLSNGNVIELFDGSQATELKVNVSAFTRKEN